MAAELPKELIVLSQASRTLAEARSLDDIREIRDKAEAARHYARSASLSLEIQNFAAELKLRAERKAGRLLSEMNLRGGDRRSKSHHATLKLDDFGLTRTQSARWQLEASVPDHIFEAYVLKAQQRQMELTSQALLRLAKSSSALRSAARRQPPAATGKTKPPQAQKTQRASTRDRLVLEYLAELKNHFGLFVKIAIPLCERSAKQIERQLARRLKSEIESLLRQLDELLGHDS